MITISWAAPLVRFSTAHPIAISFWRLAIALPLIAAIVLMRGEWREIREMRKRDVALAATAGVFLAGHFATWIASVQFTSVAASVALVCTQPVWVALIAMPTLGERPSPRQWFGITLAILGAIVIGWGDLGGGSQPLLGDMLALAGAILVSFYYVIGRDQRRRLGIWPYVLVVYGAAAVTLLLVLIGSGLEIVQGHTAADWGVFAGLALGPMIIGHTGQNYALGYLPAYVVNLTLLGEPVGATIIAWLLPAIAEVPPLSAVAGGVLVLCGILFGMRRR